MHETALFALPPKTEDRFNEVLIVSTNEPEKLEKAKQWALAKGFHGLRECEVLGDLDFSHIS